MHAKMKFRKEIKSVIIFGVLFFYGTLMFGQVVKSIGLPIDFTDANEFDPVLSNNGDKLAFISDKTGKYKIYISHLKDGEWTEPYSIDVINQFAGGQGNIYYPAFNYDASVIYFEADFNKDSSGVDIFYSKKVDGDWSEPISIGSPVNTLAYDGQPSISSDDNSLYFARNNSNAEQKDYNCYSIYVTKKNIVDQTWLSPVKLPIPINVNCEQAPKIALDNKTLYYSSVREGGKGDFDIYKTKLIAKNVWIPAENIDTINTEYNDFAPSISYNSNVAYYSISQVHKKNTLSKIYNANMPTQFLSGKSVLLKGTIRNLSTKEPLQVDIEVNDPYTSRLLYNFKSDAQTGAYEIYLPQGDEYQIDYQKEKYSHYFHTMNLKKIEKNMVVTKNVELFPGINLLLNVFDDEIYGSIEAEIQVRDRDSVLIEIPIEKVKNGRYKIELPIGEEYKVYVLADYFEQYHFSFNLNEIVQFDEFEKDVELSAKKIDFEISVSDEDTQAGIPVEVVITNLDNNEVIRTTAEADSDGKYRIKLRAGDRYNVSVSPKGYSFYNTTVDLKKKEAPKKLEVKLKQLKEDTKLTLNDITFETNSADLNESSYLELNRVVKLMMDNPDIKIEISAHTDDAGSNSYNIRLSNRRAKSVVLYMLDSKIDPDRLISKGYGESSPLVSNDSDEHKAMNRRVELKILKVEKS